MTRRASSVAARGEVRKRLRFVTRVSYVVILRVRRSLDTPRYHTVIAPIDRRAGGISRRP